MKKKISFAMIVITIFTLLFAFFYYPMNSVYAEAALSGDLIVKTYDGACSNIDKHVAFFTVEYNNKVSATRMYFYNSSKKTWSNSFKVGMTDEECKNDVKLFIENSQPSDNQIAGSLLAGLGYVTKNPYAVLNGVMQALSTSSNSSSVSSEHVKIDDGGSVTYDKTALTAIKEQLRTQYYKDIGAYFFYNYGKPIEIAQRISKYCEYDEDKAELLSLADTYDYAFASDNSPAYAGMYGFKASDFTYMYLDSTNTDEHSGVHYFIKFADSEGKVLPAPYRELLNYSSPSFSGGGRPFCGVAVEPRYIDDKLGISANATKRLITAAEDSIYSYSYLDTYFYSKVNKNVFVFKTYEAMYNFIHGSSTAYMGSQFKESVDNLTLTLDQLNQDWSAKMDAVFDTINGSIGDMANSEELQAMIDEAINKMLGVNEEIKDNTAEANKKLDSIIDLLKNQNETLKKLLGVTSDIEKSTSSLEAMTAINLGITVKNEYQKCADKAKSKFPFSVPWDMYSLIAVLAAEPEPPHFDVNYGAVLGLSNSDAYIFTVDFKDAQPISDVSRGFLSLTFISTLLTLTRKMFFNGGKIK